MTKVKIGEDCGNSPKNVFVQELTIALAKGDAKWLLSKVHDDIRWEIVGDRVIEGKSEFKDRLEKEAPVNELSILHIATHGKTGAVDGTYKFKNGKTLAFCDVYEFSNSKGNQVKAISSFKIPVK